MMKLHSIKKILMWQIKPDYVVMFLRTYALLLVCLISYLFWSNWLEEMNLLAVLGVLISALLASFSVILSINSSVKIKQRELDSQVRYFFSNTCQIKMNLSRLQVSEENTEISFFDFLDLISLFQEISKLVSKTDGYEFTGLVHNSIVGDLTLLSSYANTNARYFKNLEKSVNWPGGEFSNHKLQNPLNKIDFRIDKQIEIVNQVLSYLKNGYEQLFLENGGIEQCESMEFKTSNNQDQI